MARTPKKKPQRETYTIAVVVSQFNEFITQRLLDGCLKELARQKVLKKDISVYWVPGAFEIPTVALKLAKKKTIDAVICLGAVIRGETYHFELVAQGAATGITQASLMAQKPIIFGVLSTDTLEQAYSRAEEDGDNKGTESAQAALDMIRLLKRI
jgi:6,7-dimethyl-8-ribityllumazine synthase